MDDPHIGIAVLHLGNHIQGGGFAQVVGKAFRILVAPADFVETFGGMGKTGHAYVQAAAVLLPGGGKVPELVHFPEDHLGMGQDPLAVQGQPGTLAGTAEQGEAHFFFQLFDDVAELGLGYVHGFGRPGNGPVLGHGGKIAKIVGVHGNLLV